MKIVDDFPLPIKTVSEEEKKRLESELRKSNRILKSYHQVAKESGFKGSRRAFFASVCLGSCPITIPQEDLRAILDAKGLEQDFLAIYSRMIFKISLKWSRRIHDVSSSDVCAAAVEGFLKAFCSFTEEKRFSTYLTHCANRHICRFLSSFRNVPHRISALKSKIAKIMMDEGVSFDSALENMGLSERKKREICQSMFEVGRLSPDMEIRERQKTEMPELPKIEFLGLESLVFQEFMNSGCKINLTSLSKRTINPKTKKPYSKMAMSMAWRRVRDRLFWEFGKVA